MPQAAFDCVIRGGPVGTAVDEFDADIGIKDGVITAIGRNLAAGATEIDATDRLVLPGGVDGHGHIEQLSAAGIMNADTFESATTSAAFGGTTTAICFAAQHLGMNLMTVVDDYMALAKKGRGDRLRLPHDPRRPDRSHSQGACAGIGCPRPLDAQSVHDL